jgi:hypothetical protein
MKTKIEWKAIPNSDGLEFYRTDNKYLYAKVWKTGLSSHEVRRRGIKPYIFAGRSEQYYAIKKYFDKMSEAKKFLYIFIGKGEVYKWKRNLQQNKKIILLKCGEKSITTKKKMRA